MTEGLATAESSLLSKLPTSLGFFAAAAGGAYVLYKATRPKIGECCPGQSLGFLPQDINYLPKGKMLVIGSQGGAADSGVDAYVVGSGTQALVMHHDIFGLHTGRHKQIADELASRGFVVVVPDFFGAANGGLFGKQERGYGMSLAGVGRFIYALASGGVKKYQKDHPWDPVCEKIWVDSVAPFLKKELGCTSVGLMSFCWGAYPAVHTAALQPPAAALPVVANICFHPSFEGVANSFETEDQEALVKAAGKVPTLVYSTSMEPKSWQPDGQAHRWMQEGAANQDLVRWEAVGQMHGFMIRGDMKGNLSLANDVQRLIEEAVEFLKKHST